jgi:c-di-GMP-binding flagellar brake protein YcgR
MRGFLACDCSFNLDDQRQMEFELISFSASGMFLVQKNNHPFSIREGDCIQDMVLTLPPFSNDRFSGIVRRIMAPDSGTQGHVGFGVEFTDLSGELESKIDRFIDVQTLFFGLE